MGVRSCGASVCMCVCVCAFGMNNECLYIVRHLLSNRAPLARQGRRQEISYRFTMTTWPIEGTLGAKCESGIKKRGEHFNVKQRVYAECVFPSCTGF